jgi:hypothetical protein
MFTATIEKIGINPFVFVPEKLLADLIVQAGRHKGKIAVKMTMDGKQFDQTLVKYAGYWRLYINGPMLKATAKKVGDSATFALYYNPQPTKLPLHPKLDQALDQYPDAKRIFEALSPSLQQEIIRYLSSLKTYTSVARNVKRAIDFLLGRERFIGRDPIRR